MPRGTGLGVSVDFPRAVAMERYRLLKKKMGLPADIRKKAKLIHLKVHPFLQLKYGDKVEDAKIDYVNIAHNKN